MKHNVTLKLSLPICLSTLAIISPLSLASCSSNGIVLANFESYMAPDLMDRLHSEHSINFINYSTNEDILAKFANSYDIAVPSTYSVLELIKDGLCGEIDWSYLGQTYQLTADPERFPNQDVSIINNAKPIATNYKPQEDTSNAQTLFSEAIDNVIDAVDEYAHDNQYYGNDKSILNYAAPYFLQDWMFAYHGDYIDRLPSSTQHDDGWYSDYSTDSNSSDPVTWDDITNVISSKNPNQDSRFKPTQKHRMVMVDDSRTNYDMAHLIYDTEQNVPTPSINPTSDQTNINSIASVYSSLTDKFNPNTFRLNSDSQQVLYSFASPEGSSEEAEFAAANGIIAYNGDVLYAAMGAGIDSWENTWYCNPENPDDDAPLVNGNFHIVKPKSTPVALDMMVINKKVNTSSKKAAVYDALEKTVLEGCNQSADIDGIGASNEDDEFVYGPTLNFDFVSYTPTLYNLNQFVARDMDIPTTNNSYFDMLYPDDKNKAELLAEINNVNFSKDDGGLLELPLSNLAKSNMSTVYMKYKEKI